MKSADIGCVHIGQECPPPFRIRTPPSPQQTPRKRGVCCGEGGIDSGFSPSPPDCRGRSRFARRRNGLKPFSNPLFGFSSLPECKNPAFAGLFAEREGFEPSVALYELRRFSKPVPSATRPPLQYCCAEDEGLEPPWA